MQRAGYGATPQIHLLIIPVPASGNEVARMQHMSLYRTVLRPSVRAPAAIRALSARMSPRRAALNSSCP